MSDRATSKGVAFNLKNDFGAKCDGSTDDTGPIQAWLNKAALGVHLVAPAGQCDFTAPLVLGAAANNMTVSGAGSPTTTLMYTGASPMSATAQAASSWTGGSLAGSTWTGGGTTITLSATAPAFIATMLGYGAVVSIWDTSNTTFTSPTYVGTVKSVSGNVLTLNFGASWGSVGSTDNLLFTSDLFTINAAAQSGLGGITLKDFRISSATPLTGGFAIHARFIWNSFFDNVMLGGTDVGDNGDLCGGFWGDGIAGVHWGPVVNIMSGRACGDATLVNTAPWYGGQISTAEFVISMGAIGGDFQGGLLSAGHLGGGFGGWRCDATNMANTQRGLIIDNSIVPINNREANIGSTCAVDTPSIEGVLLNDLYVSGGTLDIDGWVASAIAGPGINIKKWNNGKVEIRGNEIYNNCGPGIEVQDATTHVLIGAGVAINSNGTNFGGALPACTAYQTANPGIGYGVYATVQTNNIQAFTAPFGNAAGPANANTGLLIPSFAAFGTVNELILTAPAGVAARLAINSSSPNIQAGLAFGVNGVQLWQFGGDGNGNLRIWDTAASSTFLLDCATGGNCTWGESASDTFTVKGTMTVTNAPASAGTGGLYLCIDSAGKLYKKASCP